MTFNIQLPSIGSKGSVKDVIINLLSLEWPLTLKQIHNRLKTHGKNVSYQAAHKAIGELLAGGVVSKQGNCYSLDADYLKKLKQFGASLESLYTNKGKDIMSELEKKNFVLIPFDKQIDMGRFLIDLIADTCEKGDSFSLMCRYVWCLLPFSEREYNQLKQIGSMTDVKILTSASRSMPVEKKFAELWENIGSKVFFDLEVAGLFETVVYKDMVIEVLFPNDIEKIRMDIRTRSFDTIDLNWFYEHIICYDATKTFLRITKDKVLADECRKHVEWLVGLKK